MYGSAVHDALENWLLNGTSVWFDQEENVNKCLANVKAAFEAIGFDADGKPEKLEKEWFEPAVGILNLVPGWMDVHFPGWQVVAAELELFEPMERHENKWFKGFVDCVIRVPKKTRKGSKSTSKYTYWILDWKTTSWGWDQKKKKDKVKKMQLALYKHFVAQKLDIPVGDIKCGFVLLKRISKNSDHCELLEVSVGDKTRLEAVRTVSQTINMIERKMWLKERGEACRYCTFFKTEHCPY